MTLACRDPGARAVARCDFLGIAPYSEASDRLDRPYLTAAHRAALEAVSGWMEEAGMNVGIDAIGNLVGRYAGGTPEAPTLLIGSHIDSVRNAGRYDGPLGVMIGIEVVAALSAAGRRLPFAIEVVAFGDEEGSRFPVSMLGSGALVGSFEPGALDLKGRDGLALREALVSFGLDPAGIAGVRRDPENVLAYVEAHIEQGPVLESLGLPLGVVTGIAGQSRLIARFEGMPGHAGTTPMHLRRDALAGAAEAILVIERVCADGPPDLVGTVGQITTSTTAFNIIAGVAEIGIDVRAAADATRLAAVAEIGAALNALADRRSLGFSLRTAQELPASPCAPELIDRMAAAVRGVGVEPMRLVSGAGHDAMTMAALAPTAMLFVRCAGGISHNPAESVTAEDTDLACRALSAFIDGLAGDRR